MCAGKWLGIVKSLHNSCFRGFLIFDNLLIPQPHYLGGVTSQTSLPSHEMQRTFLNCRVLVDLVFARTLNNQARYNDVYFRRLKANVSNTARFVCDTDFYKQKCEALFCCFEFRGVLKLRKDRC